MDRLWAPWRMKYLAAGFDKPNTGCIFCQKPQESHDKENFILFRGKTCFVILNAFPYNNGHIMIIPYLHTHSMDEIQPECSAEMWGLLVRAKNALIQAYKPDGFNIGMNVGRAAGAGIDQHLHMHIVPRWNGDVNFMFVTGETKVISQSLEDSYAALVGFFTTT